ncbi:MAG TPA: hypothetical protein VE570_11760 [Thermoleophilaceae bacterium]|jgi:hypothetical protein|nr:hypothetical protein [Thermoleophilaceae bacterium]
MPCGLLPCTLAETGGGADWARVLGLVDLVTLLSVVEAVRVAAGVAELWVCSVAEVVVGEVAA